jgi:phenylacetate-CoA ligase
VDFYATEETGIIAWECPSRSGYHVDRDHVDVEIVREDGSLAPPGEVGEIVLTNLYQRAMPIIRYRVGDMAALSDERCQCGRGLPLLTNLRGRKLDFIITPDGRLQDPFRVMSVMEHIEGIRWFRVIQTALDTVEVRLGWEGALDESGRAERRERVKQDLTQLLGDQITFQLEDAEEFRVEMGEKAPLVKGLPGQELEKLAARGYHMRI